jgi:hypothetical protein
MRQKNKDNKDGIAFFLEQLSKRRDEIFSTNQTQEGDFGLRSFLRDFDPSVLKDKIVQNPEFLDATQYKNLLTKIREWKEHDPHFEETLKQFEKYLSFSNLLNHSLGYSTTAKDAAIELEKILSIITDAHKVKANLDHINRRTENNEKNSHTVKWISIVSIVILIFGFVAGWFMSKTVLLAFIQDRFTEYKSELRDVEKSVAKINFKLTKLNDNFILSEKKRQGDLENRVEQLVKEQIKKDNIKEKLSNLKRQLDNVNYRLERFISGQPVRKQESAIEISKPPKKQPPPPPIQSSEERTKPPVSTTPPDDNDDDILRSESQPTLPKILYERDETYNDKLQYNDKKYEDRFRAIAEAFSAQDKIFETIQEKGGEVTKRLKKMERKSKQYRQ